MPNPAPASGVDLDRPARPAGARRVAVIAGAVAICAAVVPAGVERIGRAARAAPHAPAGARPEVVLARTDADVLRAWRARGLRGRTVVHVGRYLHFVEPAPQLVVRTLTLPGTGPGLDLLLANGAEARNYLWVAASLRVARRLFYVSPPEALARRLSSLRLDAAALPLRIDAEATPRTLDGSLPRLEEPVLLDVNASWFDEADGATLLEMLRAAGLPVELATVSLAEDADDVSPAAREGARRFAAALAGRPPEPLP